MELWVPGTSAEHHVVASEEPGALFALGINDYSERSGFVGADNSYHVGNAYLTDLSPSGGPYGGANCLVYNSATDKYEELNSCTDPDKLVGICKEPLCTS